MICSVAPCVGAQPIGPPLHQVAHPAVGDSHDILYGLLFGLSLVCLWLWRRAYRAEGLLSVARAVELAKDEGLRLGAALATGRGGTHRWCTCGCLIGEVPLCRPFDFDACANPFHPGAAIPWRRAPAADGTRVLAPSSSLDWCTWGVGVTILLAYWLGVVACWTVDYIASPSIARRRVSLPRMRARAIAKPRRPGGLTCPFGLPPGLCYEDGTMVQCNASSTAASACSLLEVDGDVGDAADTTSPLRPFVPPPPAPPHLPMLSVGEYGRLVASGRLPHPYSWGNTEAEQIRYAEFAVAARDPALAPDTFAERARQADPRAADLAASGSRWPHCGVEEGHKVWISGLRMRPELNGTCAVVTDLCHKTRRVGVEVQGGATINVSNRK